jgi:hypothetical protein
MSWIETARLAAEKIKKKREGTVIVQEAEELLQGADCELSEVSEKRSLHINEAVELFKKRGWIQIFSTYLNESIYLTKDNRVKVPDPAIPRYTQSEVEGLKNLTLDELKTLHEAKVLFRGTILS